MDRSLVFVRPGRQPARQTIVDGRASAGLQVLTRELLLSASKRERLPAQLRRRGGNNRKRHQVLCNCRDEQISVTTLVYPCRNYFALQDRRLRPVAYVLVSVHEPDGGRIARQRTLCMPLRYEPNMRTAFVHLKLDLNTPVFLDLGHNNAQSTCDARPALQLGVAL